MFLGERMRARYLKIHHYPSTTAEETLPPLLFVHGGYSHSLYWTVHFLPFFQAQGFDCYALDLSGHGASGGKKHLDELSLNDYVDDLIFAVHSLPAKPIIIGHSMGCVVAQRYLYSHHNAACAAVFIAPVPPSGTGMSALRLLINTPNFVAELANATNGEPPNERTLAVMAKTYFSPKTTRETILNTIHFIQPESTRAVTEMVALPPLPLFGSKPKKLPVLFMGGSEDQVFPSSLLLITALNWNGQTTIIKGAGHMIMLDPQWQDAALQIQAWIKAKAMAECTCV